MAFTDLRTFIDGAAHIGELKVIDGAHWNLEIGCLTELMAEQEGPLLVFDNIVDYPRGFRIATNVLASPRRFALALGLPTDVPKLRFSKPGAIRLAISDRSRRWKFHWGRLPRTSSKASASI